MVTNRKTIGVLSLSALALLALSTFASTPVYAHQVLATTAPFNECPPVGADTSCSILILIDSTGKVSVLTDGSQPAFDLIEDTLVGVADLCSSCGTISSITITGSSGIFGFDGDGACAGFYVPSPPAGDCSAVGPTFYESNNDTFSGVNAALTSGSVNFSPGLTSGTSAWFSLEGPPSSASGTHVCISHCGTGVPEFNFPAALVAATSMVLLALYLRFRKPSAFKSPLAGQL